MATCQPLPSLLIPGFKLPLNELDRCRLDKLTVETLSTEVHVNSKSFQNRFPPISQLQVQCNQRRKLPGNFSNLWSYGTPFLVKLLFSGNLPQAFFDELCSAIQDPVKRTKMLQRKETHVERARNLYEPKDSAKLRDEGRQLDMKILEARLRQKENMLNTQYTKQEQNRQKTEAVLLKKADIMTNGKKAYLNKIEIQAVKLRNARKAKTKRPQNIEATSTKTASIFKLTDSTKCKTPDFSNNCVK